MSELNQEALEKARVVLVGKYREIWPSEWPAKPEAEQLAEAAIAAYLAALPHSSLAARLNKIADDVGCGTLESRDLNVVIKDLREAAASLSQVPEGWRAMHDAKATLDFYATMVGEIGQPARDALAALQRNYGGGTRNFSFQLTCDLPNKSDDPGQFVDALYEAGCNDATLGIGAKGAIGLDFDREAASFDVALLSALSAIRRAIPGVHGIALNIDNSEFTAAPSLVKERGV